MNWDTILNIWIGAGFFLIGAFGLWLKGMAAFNDAEAAPFTNLLPDCVNRESEEKNDE